VAQRLYSGGRWEGEDCIKVMVWRAHTVVRDTVPKPSHLRHTKMALGKGECDVELLTQQKYGLEMH
jgi:hypothetical protein